MSHPATPESQAAAQLIWSNWQAGSVIDALPASCRPQTRAAGYAAQAALQPHNGRQLLGWKIAATSSAGQAHIQVTGPIAGRLFSGQVFDPGVRLSLQGNRMRVAEPEMAFAMARALPPRPQPYEQAEVMAAVGALHVALELPDSRFSDFTVAGDAQLLADNACAHQFVLGAAAPESWRALDLSACAVHATVRHSDGQRYERDGSGAAVLGDPRTALTWLVNELSALGLTLQAGAVVTTGTCVAPLEIIPGDRVHARFQGLGEIEVALA